MNEEKFTPGPWNIEGKCTNRVIFAVDENGVKKDYGISNIRTICRVYGGKVVGAANANLIAAAPKMYAKLKELSIAFRGALPTLSDDINSLLKEARGEE